MKKTMLGLLGMAALLGASSQAAAFCGFYVAKADTGLFNESSQVVYVRDESRNVVTMASDFKGDMKDFALVVPVPTVLQREQINVANNATLKHLDDYSAPRLVEYFDEDPCAPTMDMAMPAPAMMEAAPMRGQQRATELGVKIEAQYTVAEYDILLLSAKESGGLITWLTEQGYKLPPGAEPVVGSYLKQNMKFFVAKVNLQEYSKSGFTRLRPIQIAYNNDRFMLPIRLGTVNAQGKQELFVYALTRKGRVETTNYRTVKLPSDLDVPEYIKGKDEFASFYRDMFRTAVDKENGKAVFLEYAWDMNWCDPCAADPLSDKELRELGVFWVGADGGAQPQTRGIMPPGQGRDVYVTRLHVRYDRANFPEDLMFQATGDRENFQGRYIIRHPFKGEATCDAGKQYFRELPKRQGKVAETLARLTNRDVNGIRTKMGLGQGGSAGNSSGGGSSGGGDDDWWNSMWGQPVK
ncbi:DUF2330 domain-containing protein [Candidatus Thiothrix sp. Deng01]|uniref:DUF2330 domain-containing protein n=1 Tax=Candidatus Thiothrix phosphatis TaxID=3112415 RepID=A0ABU6D3G9_9GAMM|nr:DUF2330 domain-containing protein [Candidatus Thiothrix sp. Deng01]MEB4592863.1 DUF2330 domain-containing protein [Candidatus Thiothrix sp. Deng01]